jgi:hypothetical protein
MNQLPQGRIAIDPKQFDRSSIERIVREVLAALSAPDSPKSTPTFSPQPVSQPAVEQVFTLSDAVVSVQSLTRIPAGTKQLRIARNSLVTPAAKDWLHEKRIAWSKDNSTSHPTSHPIGNTPPQKSLFSTIATPVNSSAQLQPLPAKNNTEPSIAPVFVTGSVLWLRSLEKQLCPKQTKLDAMQSDDAASMRAVASAIRAGSRGAVAIVQAPHSALWQAARDEVLRPALVSQWGDLEDVFREVPTNVLIIPAKRWNIPGVCNIVRKFAEQIRAKS